MKARRCSGRTTLLDFAGGLVMRPTMKEHRRTHDVPVGNYIVLILAAVIFALQFDFDPHKQYLIGLILHNHLSSSLFGYMWLHTGIPHILESLVLIWIFGRDVCLKIGSANYFLAYVLVGVVAGIVHCGYDGREVIGASGAIMGILGMYVVLCFNRLSLAGPLLLLMWFLLSLTCGLLTFSPIADIGHCGGFLAGVVLANIIVFFDAAKGNETDPSLLHMLGRVRARLQLHH
jgi:membrane associated rhomboid family serine protease